MRLIAFIVILFSLLSCQSTDPAHSAYEQSVGNGRELTPVWPDQRPSETLQSDEIGRWKKVAMEAATSAEAWSRFGGERLIEGPYNVDPTRITYSMLGKGCVIRGGELYAKNYAVCDRIKVVIPTDQQSACALFLIEIVVSRESGKVLDMKDSFVESKASYLAIFKKEKTEYGCLTRRIDAPVRHNFSMFK
jgi:hypothetical protein